METESNDVETYWYVLRDLKRQNAKDPAYKVLQEEKYHLKDKLFVPLTQRVYTEFGKKVIKDVPYMPDLLFVHEERKRLDPIIDSIPTLQYRFVKGCRQHDPMKVRHTDMARFIAAVSQAEKVEYYTIDEVSPQLYGKQIRIIGGRLNGFEGRLLSKRGSKHKRIIIDLAGFISAAILVEPEYIQLLKE